MQVTQDFLPEKTFAFFGDYFPRDISGRKMARSFSAQFLLTQSDVIFWRASIRATLTLEVPARFLGLSPAPLRREATTGAILGANAGKCWWSYEPGAVDHLRSRDARALFESRR